MMHSVIKPRELDLEKEVIEMLFPLEVRQFIIPKQKLTSK